MIINTVSETYSDLDKFRKLIKMDHRTRRCSQQRSQRHSDTSPYATLDDRLSITAFIFTCARRCVPQENAFFLIQYSINDDWSVSFLSPSRPWLVYSLDCPIEAVNLILSLFREILLSEKCCADEALFSQRQYTLRTRICYLNHFSLNYNGNCVNIYLTTTFYN